MGCWSRENLHWLHRLYREQCALRVELCPAGLDCAEIPNVPYLRDVVSALATAPVLAFLGMMVIADLVGLVLLFVVYLVVLDFQLLHLVDLDLLVLGDLAIVVFVVLFLLLHFVVFYVVHAWKTLCKVPCYEWLV